jgi:hypothetical protein
MTFHNRARGTGRIVRMFGRINIGLIAVVVASACPAIADPNVGTIEVCRLPYEHHKEFAKIPAGSTFIQKYPRKVFRPKIGNQPSTYVTDYGSGYVVKTLEDAKVAPAPSCTTVHVIVAPPCCGARLAPDVPPLTKGTLLGQQFDDPATMAQFKTQVIDGFK